MTITDEHISPHIWAKCIPTPNTDINEQYDWGISHLLTQLLLTFVRYSGCFQPNTAKLQDSISHYAALWLHGSDGIVTLVNCRQHSDYIAIGSSVTVLPAVNNDV